MPYSEREGPHKYVDGVNGNVRCFCEYTPGVLDERDFRCIKKILDALREIVRMVERLVQHDEL